MKGPALEPTIILIAVGVFVMFILLAGTFTVFRLVRDEVSRGRGESTEQSRHLREELTTSVKGFGDSLTRTMRTISETQHAQLSTVGDTITKLTEITQQNILDMRTTIDSRLRHLQEDNSKKLEDMRVTVDEKLQGTLEKRLSESFKQVSDRLEKVHQGLGEMHTLTSGVGDLKRMLTNVKTRGIWGEYTGKYSGTIS